MRNAKLSFRQAERVLWGQDLAIDQASYYNLARIEAMEISPDGLKNGNKSAGEDVLYR